MGQISMWPPLGEGEDAEELNMIYRESRPFETNAEYIRFVHNWCKNCTHFKLHNGLFPEYPMNSGCPVLDAMENARFNIDEFPKKEIVEEIDDDGNVLYWHKCTKYEEKGEE